MTDRAPGPTKAEPQASATLASQAATLERLTDAGATVTPRAIGPLADKAPAGLAAPLELLERADVLLRGAEQLRAAGGEPDVRYARELLEAAIVALEGLEP